MKHIWLLLVLGVAVAPPAVWSDSVFIFPFVPERVINLDGWKGVLKTSGIEELVEVTVAYTYPNGESGIVTAEPADAPNTYSFKIPPAPNSPPGQLRYSAEALYGAHGTDRLTSKPQTLPVSYASELDITGEAAQVLLYPLAGDAYTVRYIPCCNIYGGMTYAERLTVNPVETAKGLPEKLLSDFIVLKPDGLSASTMGMYFDFKLGPEAFKSAGGGTPALYEFDGEKWVETQTYEMNRDAGAVTMHTPNGGEYVLGVKH